MSNSIDKIDEQIKKLSGNKIGDVSTEKISKKELLRKVKLKELDEKIEGNKKNSIKKSTNKSGTKSIEKCNIKHNTKCNRDLNLEKKLRNLYEKNDSLSEKKNCTVDKTKVFTSGLKSAKSVTEDVEFEEDKLSRIVIILFFIFMVLVIFYIIFFIAISFV